jgi:hypothetical protein
MEKAEVGLALRMRIPEVRKDVLGLHRAEVALGEPVRERELVDDASGPLNPFSVSIGAAEKQLVQRELRCVRVANVSG